LRGAFLVPTDAFFVPQEHILKAWTTALPERGKPQNNHRYVIFWDPSVSADPTVVIILDVSSKPFRGVYFERWQTPMGIHALLAEITRLHVEWNTLNPRQPGFKPRAITGFDSTSMGGAIIRQQLERLTPKRPLNFGGKVKMNALTNARASLSRQDIVVPAGWLRLQREVLGYRLDDTKITQDAVMAFAGAAHLAVMGFTGAAKQAFNTSYRALVQGRS